MEIKIDPATLPADGQGVRYQTQDEEWHDGYFIEGENMFWVNDSKWHYAWHVLQWENTDPEHIVESRKDKIKLP